MRTTAQDPEVVCRRCSGPNVSWHAPSPLWNAVMRDGSIDGPWKFEELICPTCFCVLAEQAGIASGWRLDARAVNVQLETVTPSGRIWDAETDLWKDPEPVVEDSDQPEEECPFRGLHAYVSASLGCSHCSYGGSGIYR